MGNDARVDAAAASIREATAKLPPNEKQAAAELAGITIPGPKDIPDSAWQRMSGWQVLVLLLVMFLVLVGLFVFLLLLGREMVTAANASESATTLGNTIIGAALGMIGAAAAGAGATAVRK